MEPLHKTSMIFTYEEFKKFNSAVQRENFTRLWPLFLVCAIVIVAAAIIAPEVIFEMRFFLLGLVIFLAVFLIVMRLMLKGLYKKGIIPENSTIELFFYADHLNSVTPVGNTLMNYDKIARIIETDTNFYIMTPQNQGFLVVKRNCTPELIVFIRELEAERKLAKKKK